MSARLTATCVVCIAILAAPSRALAFPGSGGGQGTGGQAAGVLTAGVSYATPGGSSGGGGGSDCTWALADQEVGVNGFTATWPMVRDGVTYHLYRRTCGNDVAYVEVPERQPQDLLPGLLAQLRERALPEPVPVFQLLDPEFGWAYVRTPLDFRAGEESWRPVSVTAAIGPVWATVTARPESLTFHPGDPAGPGPVSCGGEGPVAPYVPEAPGECSYTYLNASSTSPFDGYHFETSMEIEWSISWTSSTGAGGSLASYTTSASALLAVAEVQGLVTCTGSRPEQGGCG